MVGRLGNAVDADVPDEIRGFGDKTQRDISVFERRVHGDVGILARPVEALDGITDIGGMKRPAFFDGEHRRELIVGERLVGGIEADGGDRFSFVIVSRCQEGSSAAQREHEHTYATATRDRHKRPCYRSHCYHLVWMGSSRASDKSTAPLANARGSAGSVTAQSDRYSRQILFQGIGETGQRKILDARIAIVGCGALGSFQAGALARARAGCLRIIDRDAVEFSNLQRQWLFEESDAREALPKAVAAARAIGRINSGVKGGPLVLDLPPAA